MSENLTKKETPKVRAQNLKYLRDKNREPVKGIFRFYEVPGGSMSFSFKEFKEDQVERYDFIDGEVYSIPLGVAKHLNKNGWYPEYEYLPGQPGVQASPNGLHGATMRVGKKVRRFGFQSLEFVDIEELNQGNSPIVTVEHTI